MSRKSFDGLTSDETLGGKVPDWSSFVPITDWTGGTVMLLVRNVVGIVDGTNMILWIVGALIDKCGVWGGRIGASQVWTNFAWNVTVLYKGVNCFLTILVDKVLNIGVGFPFAGLFKLMLWLFWLNHLLYKLELELLFE